MFNTSIVADPDKALHREHTTHNVFNSRLPATVLPFLTAASQHAFHPTGAMPTVTLLFPLCDSWATPALGHSSCERAAERHRPGSGPCPSHVSQHHLFPALEKPLPPAVMRWPCHKVCMHATVKAIVPRYGNHVKHWQII